MKSPLRTPVPIVCAIETPTASSTGCAWFTPGPSEKATQPVWVKGEKI